MSIDEKDERNSFLRLPPPGMQGCPDIATVYQYLGKDHTERFSQSLTFRRHNKGERASGGCPNRSRTVGD